MSCNTEQTVNRAATSFFLLLYEWMYLKKKTARRILTWSRKKTKDRELTQMKR